MRLRRGASPTTAPAVICSALNPFAIHEARGLALKIVANQPGSALATASVAAIIPAPLAHTGRLAKRLALPRVAAGRGSGAQATTSSTTVGSALFAVAGRSASHVHAKSSLTAFVLAAHPAACPTSIVPALLAKAIGRTGPLNALTDVAALESHGTHATSPSAAVGSALLSCATGDTGRHTLSSLTGLGSLASATRASATIRPALFFRAIGQAAVAGTVAMLLTASSTDCVPLVAAAGGIFCTNAGLAIAPQAPRPRGRDAPAQRTTPSTQFAKAHASDVPSDFTAIGVLVADARLAGCTAGSSLFKGGRTPWSFAGERKLTGWIGSREGAAVVDSPFDAPSTGWLFSARKLAQHPILAPLH